MIKKYGTETLSVPSYQVTKIQGKYNVNNNNNNNNNNTQTEKLQQIGQI